MYLFFDISPSVNVMKTQWKCSMTSMKPPYTKYNSKKKKHLLSTLPASPSSQQSTRMRPPRSPWQQGLGKAGHSCPAHILQNNTPLLLHGSNILFHTGFYKVIAKQTCACETRMPLRQQSQNMTKSLRGLVVWWHPICLSKSTIMWYFIRSTANLL